MFFFLKRVLRQILVREERVGDGVLFFFFFCELLALFNIF